MQISRRSALSFGAAGTLAFCGLTKAFAVETHRASYYNEVEGYGPLREDKARIVDLPPGFSYRIISQAGETMDDGLLVPHVFDGMGCFPGKGDEIILVRNHELLPEHRDFGSLGMNGRLIERLDKTKVYDFEDSGLPLGGGTTTVVYDLKKNKVIRQHQSLIGTTTNCAGGTTPWGSWLSCEESVLRKGQGVGKDHGYVFEVPSNSRGLIDPLPIRAMGRFKHEAACIDPRTGIAYMTEDVEDGLFYRYLPDDRSDLKKGGRLEAMGLKAHPEGCDTSNRKDALWRAGERFEVVWIPLDDVENPNDDLRYRGFKAGAAQVCRGEGIHFGNNEVFICATAGGAVGSGQILRYAPSPHEGQANEKDRPGVVSLFLESINEKVFDYGDNLTVSPWGHLFVCEDRYSDTLQNHLRIVTPEGKVATFARNVFKGNGEWAGACFSPDGSTLFVNVQWPGFTLAITGPWASFRAAAVS